MRLEYHGGHERVAGLAVLDRSAGHRLGGVRPRGRKPELAWAGGRSRSWRPSSSGLSRAARDKSIRGLVFISGKEKGFIVGADVREFDQAQTEQQVAEAVTLVNGYLDRIERLPIPVVCCIHGFCLGGGLELALACHWRIATRDDATRIGFPEVRLGIFPGFNGTARSIRQAGALSAMPLMLTGSMIRATAARGMGLVDELAPSPLNLPWMARKAIDRKRKSKCGAALEGRAAHWRRRAGCSPRSSAPRRPRRCARSTIPRPTA